MGHRSKTRIDFNHDRTTRRPPQINVSWGPTKAERLQAAQRKIGDTPVLTISEQGRTDVLPTDEVRAIANFG